MLGVGNCEIENCKNYGDITIGSDSCGGVSGMVNSCIYTRCANYGNINSLNGNGAQVSGLLGRVVKTEDGTLNSGITTARECLNAGSVTGEYASGIGNVHRTGILSVVNSYNVGKTGVEGKNYTVGGLCAGYAGSEVRIEKSYNAGKILGNNSSGIFKSHKEGIGDDVELKTSDVFSVGTSYNEEYDIELGALIEKINTGFDKSIWVTDYNEAPESQKGEKKYPILKWEQEN